MPLRVFPVAFTIAVPERTRSLTSYRLHSASAAIMR
jgi:hypothetical protein